MRNLLIAASLLSATQLVLAEPPPSLEEPPQPTGISASGEQETEQSVLVRDPSAEEEPIELPPQLESGEPMDPEITIIKRGDKTIHEYRINGELYMLKIIPSVGPAYYMVDTNGDGNLNVRRSDHEKGLSVPQWVLFSWD